ncbi:HAD family hydrolase [Loktanella sp. SALINAS62]|uniref:HAD family hydrolase n=1 Tax=Loktanella sp. SALINAS62 TaxID=2706124 RepID=UPI001B8AA0A9|nr:HAD family hydrolase [Loktanella sp. SALINAS62]MBS1301793.1 hypothetical protein [Loktanella sp. SALINAS62]
MVAPERAAQEAARRKFARLGRDANNFTHPDQLSALLSPYQLVSFDLFDTLIWREIALEDVHLKTAEFGERVICGEDGPLPAGLLMHCRQRHQAALKAIGMTQDAEFRNEVDLAEVFDSALAPYITDNARRALAVEALISYELETERRTLVLNPVMRDFLVRLRAHGKTLILVSDMYLRERWLRPILEDHGLDDLFDHVFVSCDMGVTKNSGLMFDRIDAQLGSGDWRRMHLGDNWINDVLRPREHGWDALHYFESENEIRKARLDHLTQLGAHRRPAAARRLISQITEGDPTEGLVRLISAGFVSFTRKVLATAQQGRFDRVLFLTRDGTIYHHLLRQLIADTGAPGALNLPQFQDLAFSRRAGVLLTCPDLSAPGWEDYIRLHVRWMQDEEATQGSIISAFGLQPEELGPLAEANDGMPIKDIMADAAMSSALNAALQAKRQRVVDYLDQQDLFAPDQRILLVDIGYSGTVLKSLSEHIYALEAGGRSVRSRLVLMMFAANRYYAGNLGRMHPRAAMLDTAMIGRADWRHRAAALNFAWLEPFAVDRSRGSLRDFRADASGRLQPVFGPGSAKVGSVSRGRLLSTASAMDRLLRISPLPDATADAAIAQAITSHFTAPKRATLKAVDGLTHQAGLTEITEGSLLTRVRPWRLQSDLSRCVYEDRWVQGSMAASHLGWLNPLLNRLIGLLTQ